MAKDSQYFVENKGQWNSRAKFLSRTPNLDLWVTKQGLVLDYYKRTHKNGSSRREGHAIDMQFVGANPNAFASGFEAAPFVSQYFGAHAKFSDAKVAKSYREARVSGIYPGIDMRVYMQSNRPRYDIEVAPGASANNIKLMFKGAEHLSVDKNGNLLIPSKLKKIQQEGLYAYQIVNGVRKSVEARFTVTGSNTVAFHLGAYDHTKKLIVDPLIYGSYYGGDGGLDEVRAVVADSDSSVYMTGLTGSTDFPLKFGTYVSLNGLSDSFLTRFQGDAYGIDYASYFGGSGNDTGKFIALDPTGNNVWVAGMTNSPDFPGIDGTSFQNSLVGSTDVYLIRFARDPVSVMVPVYSTYFHSSNAGSGQELKGFAVSQISGKLFIGGETTGTGLPSAVNSYPVGSAQAGFVTSMASDGQSVVYSRYVGGTAPVVAGFNGIMPNGLTSGTLLFWPIPNPPVTQPDPTSGETGNALAINQADEAFLTGTVFFQGNQDTSSAANPAFPTTAGVFTNGRLLRNNDAFLTKIDPTGSVLFSTLIGGADNDSGSSVAVDRTGNAYVTGTAGSFDFPRTRGTFGQDFSVGRTYITKVSQDGTTIVYSTGLNTRGNCVTTGISVDQRNYVFVTGEVFDMVQFPLPPGDPWEPSGQTQDPASIPTTPDAIRSTYTYPQAPDMSSSDAWLMVLNDTATTEIYGTYIGGDCDDYAYSPYNDRFGDCWVVGWTDVSRQYSTFSSDGTTENDYSDTGGIAPFITALAFKVAGGGGGDFVDEHYGDYAENLLPFGASPATFGMFRARDGYVLRFRLDIPIVQSLVLNPSKIPGGLGATSTGTITLNTAATGAGVDVNVSLSDVSAASLDPSQPVGSEVINIPAGQTTATFTIYSSEVSDPAQVDVKAEYLGNFQVARLTVVPWLQKFTLSPSTVVGGNNVSGSITLADNAPAGGFDVTLLTNDASTILFPGGNTVTIPAGQNFANFTIQTMGVDSQTDYTVSVSALSVGITQTLTLTPASLLSVTFAPGRVAGGTSSTGTLRLDGLPGPSGFNVDLSINGNPAGYSVVPTTLAFTSADRQENFTVNTAPEAVNTQKVITAHRAAQGTYTDQTKTGTLFIDANFLTNFTLNPTTVNAGQNSTGTVTISNTAETGGVVVNLSSDNTAVATVPATVVVPAGSTNGTFTVTTLATAVDTIVHIHAIRGTNDISRALTVKGVTFTLSANPTSVIGGAQDITGTVTLALPAPVGGVSVDLLSSAPSAASVPANVIVPEGSRTVNFPIATHTVATTQTVTITGQTQPGTTATTQVQIRAISLASLVFNPTYVKGGTFTHVQVSLDAPAPAGGATVILTSTNTTVLNPGPITIPAGQTTSAVITVPVGRVNRLLAVTVTGQYNGRFIASTITVHP
ncbi:MAG TPA: SBBP repeat-containing protein [Fimbriimonadaceae bacterium]|nr:SBBP repeat-containing protein [Fimbriimonadaceae bacterium]